MSRFEIQGHFFSVFLTCFGDVFAGFANKTTPKLELTRELILTKLDKVDDKTFDQFHMDAVELPKNAWSPTLRALLGVDK